MTIAAAADRAPPLVTLTAPRQALPGATVTITVGASDNDTVSSVVLSIEGEAPTTFTAAPYSRTYTLPAIAAPGSRHSPDRLGDGPVEQYRPGDRDDHGRRAARHRSRRRPR